MDFLTLVIMGGLAGVMAGLLGIGGGALIVPVLVIVFEGQGVNPNIIMQLALGPRSQPSCSPPSPRPVRITAAARSMSASFAASRRR
jgi:uncharacterized membrane protein YfcA